MINPSENESANWIDKIIINAISNRASDIHFEPQRTGLTIRIRVDGLLQQIENIDKISQENILSRIKVLSKLNITEHRLPQDGHYELNYMGKYYNFRVSTLPTAFGETIVFRILNRDDAVIPLEQLGFFPEQLELLYKLITNSSGMILATGPTGSGKTSLLYSMIRFLNKPDKNIVTVEDPIECELDNIRQTQINESIGLSFAKTLRAIVRQDPDYIMVGEIRDGETAEMAVQSALSGTMVLSTFHTFDVPSLINRFTEMGISNSVIAQSIKGVISARLIRTICTSCTAAYTLSAEEKKMWGTRPLPESFMKGKGCSQCLNTGYKGRTGLFEIMHIDQEIQAGIIEKKPASYLYTLIKNKKILSLREGGYTKVMQGITTISEIVRILGVPMDA